MKKLYLGMLDCMYISEEQLRKKLTAAGFDLNKPIRNYNEAEGVCYTQEEETKLMTIKDMLNLQAGLDQIIMDRVKESGKDMAENDLLNSKLVALFTEVGEFSNELSSFKYWRQGHKVDMQKVITEYVDVLFFHLSIGCLLGFTAEQIQEAYMDKWNINVRRQKEGY